MLAELHQERCARATRYKTTAINGMMINYKEQPGAALGSIMWSGSIYLSKYLQKIAEDLYNKTILELGSGIGICSIISSKLGGKVLSTDKSDTLNIIKENSELNNVDLQIKEYL